MCKITIYQLIIHSIEEIMTGKCNVRAKKKPEWESISPISDLVKLCIISAYAVIPAGLSFFLIPNFSDSDQIASGFSVQYCKASMKAEVAALQADSVPVRMAPLELAWVGGAQYWAIFVSPDFRALSMA